MWCACVCVCVCVCMCVCVRVLYLRMYMCACVVGTHIHSLDTAEAANRHSGVWRQDSLQSSSSCSCSPWPACRPGSGRA